MTRSILSIDPAQFEVLTFDCYGTLIDWEAGIYDALRPILIAHGTPLEKEAAHALPHCVVPDLNTLVSHMVQT